jgi:large subunit ribosomal protein L4
MQLRVASTFGKETALTVRDDVFGVVPNAPLMAQAIRVYLSNQRQGTSKVKTRSEIARTKKKWFKQKGTGNARHGARTPSIFVGGGVSHGPNGMQNWTLKLPANMKKAALTSALSAQAQNVVVSDDITQLDGKTASAQKMLTKMMPEARHILIVLDKVTPMVIRSLSNLEKVFLTTADRLTTYEVAYADSIILTKEAVKKLEARLGKDEEVKAKAAVAAADKTDGAEVSEKKAAKSEPKAKPAAKKAPAKVAKAKTEVKAEKKAKK